MKDHPNFYAIIPANVRYDKELKPAAKLLYAEISALTSAQGFCFATNKYFAGLYEVSTRTVQQWLEQLSAKQYIELQHSEKGGGRKIYLSAAGGAKNIIWGDEKKFTGGMKKSSRGGENFFTHINKDIIKDINTLSPAKIENEPETKTSPLNAEEKRTPPVAAAPPLNSSGIDALSAQILSVIQEKTGGSETVLDTWRQRNPALTVDMLRKEIKEYARYYFKKIADTRVNEAGMSEETILSFRLDEVNRKLPSHFRADFAQIWLPRIGQRTGTPRPNSPKFETPRREMREL